MTIRNPFPTLKEWQQEKKKYGIPGSVLKKGAFGEKMDKLSKTFVARGGPAPTLTNIANILRVLDDGRVVVDEWLKKARTMKPGDFKNKSGAIELVEHYSGMLDLTESRVHAAVDPLHEARTGIKKAMDLYRKAVTNPSDAPTLRKLWDSGCRQYVGQSFRTALKNANALGYSPAIVTHLDNYNKLMEKWMDEMLDGNGTATAADPDAREDFMNDMHRALSIASTVLKQQAAPQH